MGKDLFSPFLIFMGKFGTQMEKIWNQWAVLISHCTEMLIEMWPLPAVRLETKHLLICRGNKTKPMHNAGFLKFLKLTLLSTAHFPLHNQLKHNSNNTNTSHGFSSTEVDFSCNRVTNLAVKHSLAQKLLCSDWELVFWLRVFHSIRPSRLCSSCPARWMSVQCSGWKSAEQAWCYVIGVRGSREAWKTNRL